MTLAELNKLIIDATLNLVLDRTKTCATGHLKPSGVITVTRSGEDVHYIIAQPNSYVTGTVNHDYRAHARDWLDSLDYWDKHSM